MVSMDYTVCHAALARPEGARIFRAAGEVNCGVVVCLFTRRSVTAPMHSIGDSRVM